MRFWWVEGGVASAALLFCALSIPARGQSDPVVAGVTGPDVIVSEIHVGVSNYGSLDVNPDPVQTDFISAFAIGTTSCNIGNQNLDWFPSAGSNQHPVIAQSAYRMNNGRFEQIGMSWLKHGFFAVNDSFCGVVCEAPEDNPPGTQLFVGCSDPYSSGLNGDRQYMGPTFEVNAHTGYFPARHSPANATSIITSRLQIRNQDIDQTLNAGSLFFVQAHYVHPDDAAPAVELDDNNASYRRVNFSKPNPTTMPERYNMTVVGATQSQDYGIRAWQDNDATVELVEARVPGEGLFVVGSKVTDMLNGFHRYEYAIQNLNSDRSGGSFRVPLPEGVVLQNIGFHDVEHHSGDGEVCLHCTCIGGTRNTFACERQDDCPGGSCAGVRACVGGTMDTRACTTSADCPNGVCTVGGRQNYDSTDWAVTVVEGSITWATSPYATDFNANALRWGTLYNFRFDANIGPDTTCEFAPNCSNVTLGLFKPGFPSDFTFAARGPALDFIDCNVNGLSDICDVSCAGLGCDEPCGFSDDCNENNVPDECEADCNQNVIADECDIRDRTSTDCNENTVPDDCELDCDNDGTIDACELVLDRDADGVEDCADLCPDTTPVGGCLPPINEIVACCFENSGILVEFTFTWAQCVGTMGIPVCDNPPVCPGTQCPETQCRDGCLVGDFDRDGDFDLFDAGALEICFSGPFGESGFVPPSAECLLRFDFDSDGDVDLADHVPFRAEMNGP